MPTTNEALIRKAVINAADALASAGKLNAEQADAFLDYVVEETMLTKVARVVRFRPESLDLDKIGIGRRAAVPASEGIDPGRRRGVSHTKVTLTPVEIMVPMEISTTYKEQNLEGDAVTDHILRMFAAQLANDVEELSIHGNTSGYLVTEDYLDDGGSTTKVVVDTFMALFNGWLTLTNSANVVDHAGGTLSGSLFRKMLAAMPSKFKRNKGNLRWICSTETEELWRERMSTRATALGDNAMNSQGELTPFGIKMVPCPLFDHYPRQIQTGSQFSGLGATIQLAHAPILANSVKIVLSSQAGATPVTPFVEDTAFTVNETTGVITETGGVITTGVNLTITYQSMPEILLTHESNLILGYSRDISIEKDRDIYKRVDQYATTLKVAAQIEELTACVKAKNISDAI